MRMSYLPRARIVHTSGDAIGQIYIPAVNWLLMTGVLLLVLGFNSSEALSAAYGIAMSITMVTTTLLAGVVARGLWRVNRWLVAVGVGVFAAIDLTFVVANSLKIAEGGWLTLMVAAGTMLVFTTWYKGRALGMAAQAQQMVPLAPFVESLELDMPHRVRGTAVFLTPEAQVVPHALLHNLAHNQVLHDQVIVLALQSADTPRVPARDRLTAQDMGHDIWAVTRATASWKSAMCPNWCACWPTKRGWRSIP